MSTTTKTSRGKPVTLAKSASGEPATPKAEAKSQAKAETKTIGKKSAEAASPAETLKPAAPHVESAQTAATAADLAAAADPHFAAKWNDLVKAQSDAAMAWWQDAKDARTFADAIAVNARHSRVQLELAADQAREMAAYFQKTFEGNADRLRAMLTPGER